MFIGLGMPIPDLSNKPGPGRPGWGPAGSYDFQFEVTGAVTIKAQPAATGTFTIKWPDGTEQTTAGSNSIPAPNATAGIVSINNELDNTYADEFKIVSGQANVTKVISWGQNPWSIVEEAFKDCVNLTDISTTSFIAGTANVSNQASGCVMGKMFLGCTSLLEVDIRTWDLSTNGASWRLGGPFANLANLQKLDATGLKIKFFDSNSVSTSNFANIGTNVADGCEFKMAGLDLSTSLTGYLDSLFAGTKFKGGSNLSNWKFPVNFNPSGWRGNNWFSNCILNDGILDISGWTTWPGLNVPGFGSFNSALTSQGTARIDLSNLGLTNASDFSYMFYVCKIKEIIGLNTWGACAGNANMFRMFMGSTLMRINPNDNFSDTFIASLSPTNLSNAFNSFGNGLLDAERGVAMNFNNIDFSNAPSFDSTWRLAKLLDAPNFSTATFDNNNTISFPTTFRSFNALNADSSFVLNGGKVTSFSSTFYAAAINTININDGVDLSALTSASAMFYYSSATTATLPSDANYSSLTNFGIWITGFSGFSVCQGDILMRRLKATNLNSSITATLPKITESPALVNSDRDFLENTRSWNITTATPDAALPFAYASYAVDPTGITTISPTTTPPAGSVFTATNGLSISASGVITIGTFRGGSTIRCTYPDGCYNEVVMLIQVPFVMRTKIPAGSSNFTLSPQMSNGECFVDWGDTNSETLTGSTTHSYATSGSDQEYDIKLFDSPSGSKFTGFASELGSTEASYEKTILKWGDIEWQNNAWFGTTTTGVYKIRLAAPNGADHKPNLSQVTSLYKMFGTTQPYKTDIGTGWFEDTNDNLENWDVSTIENMSYMFRNPDPVSTKDDGSDNVLKCANWDVSNVQNFNYFMGGHRTSTQVSRNWSVQLNIEMTNWNTSGATDMSYMFWQHQRTKPGIENFRTENVTNLSFFYGGGTWNAKTKMYNSILRWDVSNVENFSSASIVVGTNETDTNANFPNNWRFSTDASKNLNFSKFCGGDYMRLGAGPYYLTDLQAFATKTINETFYGGTSYTAWNMDNASNISDFGGSSFRGGPPLGLFRNYNIADWNITSKCTSFYNLFVSGRAAGGAAIPFDQNLSGWNITGITGNQGYFMRGQEYTPLNPVNMSTSNYDATLIGWGAHAANAQSGVTVNFGNSQYTANTGPATTGNTTLASGNVTLYDSNKNFTTLGVQIGDIAYNTTSQLYSKIIGVGNGYLTTDQSIWGTQGDGYSLETTNAAKGRYALIEAGWAITDGGAAPFQVQPFKFKVSVPAGTSTTITVPYVTGTDYTVNWGDNSEDNNLNTSNAAVTHTYDGTVTNPEISFGKTGDTGLPTRVSFNRAGSKAAVTEITQWGNLQFTSLNYQFRECTNLTTISATDLPDWSKITNSVGMYLMFNDAPLNSVHSSMANWDVSMMRSFNQCFGDSTGLNIDLSSWDVSGVDQASGFSNMFNGCSSLNFDAGQWTLPTHRSDYSLSGMFANCSSFNQDLSSWDILNRVTSLSGMFTSCTSFTAANLDQWDISNVTNIGTLFFNCTSITNLDVSNWNTGNVTYMLRTFEGTSNWNPDVTNWDVSKVTGNNSMQEMFENSGFNRNIAGWQLNTNMSGASEMQHMFRSSSMSTANYTDTIVGWANYVKNQNPDAPLNISMSGQTGMTFDSNRSGGANFANAFAARQFLTDTVANGGAAWTISGDTVTTLLVSSTNSLSFNGSTEYIDTFYAPDSSLANAFSISAYVKASSIDTSSNAGNTIIGTYDFTNLSGSGGQDRARFYVNIQNNSGAYELLVGFGTFQNAYELSNFTLSQWNHIAVTYDGSNLKLYCNGGSPEHTISLSSLGSLPPLGSYDAHLYIGATNRFSGTQSVDQHWHGDIDEVMLWNTAITQANVQTIDDAIGSGNVPDPNSLSSGVQLWNRMGD